MYWSSNRTLHQDESVIKFPETTTDKLDAIRRTFKNLSIRVENFYEQQVAGSVSGFFLISWKKPGVINHERNSQKVPM
jgi:hypothetical protein